MTFYSWAMEWALPITAIVMVVTLAIFMWSLNSNDKITAMSSEDKK